MTQGSKRIQSLAQLRDEMKAVARGERKAPSRANSISFNSVEALGRLLNTENRHLLALIRDEKPNSIAMLANLSGRAASNLNRTLEKMQRAGFVRFVTQGRNKAPRTTINKIMMEIDPFSNRDAIKVR